MGNFAADTDPESRWRHKICRLAHAQLLWIHAVKPVIHRSLYVRVWIRMRFCQFGTAIFFQALLFASRKLSIVGCLIGQ